MDKDINEELKDFFDDDEVFDTVIMIDENGEETEFVIIDAIDVDKVKYLLVVAAEDADLDEPEATILKEIKTNNDNAVYELVENDDEFNKVSILLQDNEGDYEMKF